MDGVLGPLDRPIDIEDFSYEDVLGKECLGQVCKKICKIIKSQHDNKKFLCICIPCYNETSYDLMKTIASIMENVDFMKNKTRFNNDDLGRKLKDDFHDLVPIIVPVFDGVSAMHPSVTTWLTHDFENVLDDMNGSSESTKCEVRVCSSRWWYYCWDTLRTGDIPSRRTDSLSGSKHDIEMSTRESSAQSYLHFQLVPIIKRNNHRKHNSHHWFFQGICAGLNASLVFLTDCSTTYKETCLARLVYAIRCRQDLIGVTARQRVETPCTNFHPCELTKLPFLRSHNRHQGIGSKPCWKCWASFLLSPAPLQGFEYEASLILTSSMFNLVEALPVLPGPCQLLDWPKMRANRVVEEYFDLLFNEDSETPGENYIKERPLPVGYRRSRNSFSSESSSMPSPIPSVSPIHARSCTRSESEDDDDIDIDALVMRSSVAATPPAQQSSSVSLTEFLRVNMRLAEDRVLSFVSVFSTGFGTKWIPGSTFYYEPEVCFSSLLTQRRRWINGTVASLLYFFTSKRARLRVFGGFFDTYKAGKNPRLVNLLWGLNLFQFILALLSPAVFNAALQRSLYSGSRFTTLLSWGREEVINLEGVGCIDVSTVVVMITSTVYVMWVFLSYTAEKGRIHEGVCVLVALFGMIAVLPVYIAVIASAAASMGAIHIVVALTVIGPIIIGSAQSMTSAVLYLCYLPWFLLLSAFFLVYIPSYAFARLWDTTWGNRETARDGAIDSSRENSMKCSVKYFNVALVTVNCVLTYVFCTQLGDDAQFAVMLMIFFPTIVQFIGSLFFLFMVLPFSSRRKDEVSFDGKN